MAYIYGTTTYAKDSNGNVITYNGTKVYQVRLGYQLNSQDTQLKQSNISLRLEVRSVNSQYTTYGPTQTTTIDGTTFGAKTIDFRSTNTWQIFATKTFDVTHNDDGTYKVSKTGSFTTTASGTGRPKSGSASVMVELPTINTALQVHVNDANIGSSTTISVNGTAPNLKLSYWYKLTGDSNWTLIAQNAGTSYSWTVPTSFYNEIPNAQTLECQFKAETFYDDVSAGITTTTATFTATGNPVINTATLTDTNSVTAQLTTGANTSTTKMIKGFSNVQISLNVNSRNSSTVKYITINNNTIYTAPSQNPPSTVTITTTINSATTNAFLISVIDSRNYETYVLAGDTTQITTTNSLQLVNYIPLTINATIKRNEPTDGIVNISASGNYFNSSFGNQNNTLTVQYRYKESTSSTWSSWTSLTATKNNNTYNVATIQVSNIDYTKQYDFEVKAIDKIYTEGKKYIQTVTKGTPVYWWDNDEFNVNGTLGVGSETNLNGLTNRGRVELFHSTPYIDFHYNNSTSDYTSRIIETSSGKLQVTGKLGVAGDFQTKRKFLYSLDAINGQGRYYKLANIPASSNENAIQLNIKGTIGNWTTNKATIDVQVSNRQELNVYGTLYGKVVALDSQRIVVYQESNNSHTIYLYNVSSYTGPNTLEITWGSYVNTLPTIYTDYSYTTSPSGTQVWNMGTSSSVNDNMSILQTRTGSSIVTRSSGGTLNSSNYAMYGKVCQLELTITTTSNISVGSNAFEGTVNTGYRPKYMINSSTYNGSVVILGSINTSGTITIRVASAQLASGKQFTIGFTYII